MTGFGLLGHVYELASRSGVRVVLDADSLPALPGALELAAAGVRTGGDRRNRDFAEAHVEIGADASVVTLAFDPQTAGGLLVSFPAERAPFSKRRWLPTASSRGEGRQGRGRLGVGFF